MKSITLVVLFFFVHFIAMPTIAVWSDIELDIPTITISEENKKPITNAEEEHSHSWDVEGVSVFKFESLESESAGFFKNTSLMYLLHEYEVQSPPPEQLT